MKRVWQGTSAAKRSKRSSAAGSRSIAIRVPSAPSSAAIRRAWPPPPKVQSTAVCPGSGASSEVSSAARTGSCSMGIIQTMAAPMLARGSRNRRSLRVGAHSAEGMHLTRRSARGQALGDLGGGGVELLLLLGPGLGVPDLQVLAGADHDAGAVEAGVLDQRLGDADAPGGVELLVEGAAVEAAAQAARVACRTGCAARGSGRRAARTRSVVCTQTQGSKPLERTMPSERAARNREGTVRRSLESRLCS